MKKTAIILMADTEQVSDKARLSLAMLVLRELDEAGDEAKIIFEGAGTKWIKQLSDPQHKINSFYNKIKNKIEVCSYCANAYGVKEVAIKENLKLVTEYKGHPSIRKLIFDDYTIITY